VVKSGWLALASLLLALLLGLRLADGTAGFLVQEWYLPILLVTAIAFAGFALWAALPSLRERRTAFSRPTGAGMLTAALVGVPLALGFAYKPEPLGSGSLGGESSVRDFAAAASADPAVRNIYQWAWEFQTADPATIVGDPVEVIGFVYNHPDDAPGTFRVARFVVACCIADAQGFSLPVQWKDSTLLSSDRWVRVAGRVATSPSGEPVIQATSVEEIDPPANPYIYP